MGFWRSSPEPQGPVPEISLHLASPEETVFKPNDTVSGTVTLNTPIPINPQAIEVSLWGESKVWIRRSRRSGDSTYYDHYRDRAPYFTVTFNLLEKPQELVPGRTYTYPFNFRVPEGTGFNRTGCYKNADDERWTTLPHHLPPTFFFGSSPDDPDNASISYGVTTKLICPGVGVGKKFEAPAVTKEIIFQPLNPNLHLLAPGAPLCVVPFTKRFTLQTSALSGQDPSSISFRQRMSDRFSSATPKVDFDLGIEIPDLLTTGSEFHFRTSFTAIDRSENVIHIPPVRFKIEKLELLDFTVFRAKRDWNAGNTMSGSHSKSGRDYTPSPTSSRYNDEDKISREKKTRLNAVPPEHTVELPDVEVPGEKKQMEQASRCEHWFSARVPGFTPPSFQSFAVSRTYRIKIRVRAEIGDKKFDYETECHVRQMGSV